MKYFKDMKTSLAIYLIIMWLPQINNAQISTSTVVKPEYEPSIKEYKGGKNFLGKDVSLYLGEELHLNGKSQSSRKYGYRDFYSDYTGRTSSSKNTIYKRDKDSHASDYDSMVGKYFSVKEINTHPKSKESNFYERYSYLVLEEKESKEILYFKYDSRIESNFPFIAVSHFNFMKNRFLGKEFIFRPSYYPLKKNYDVNGKEIKNNLGDVWKCNGITIEDEYFNLSLFMNSPSNQSIYINIEHILKRLEWRKTAIFTPDEYQAYLNRYGTNEWKSILDGVISIGFTEEMVRLARGKPKSINSSSYGNSQWVYSSEYHSTYYLYFKDGILKSWNE